MNQFIFTKKAEKRFGRFPESVQKRLIEKMRSLKNHQDILSILKKLHHLEPATHRLRVGDYRVILELKEKTNKKMIFWVLDVGDRKEIYK